MQQKVKIAVLISTWESVQTHSQACKVHLQVLFFKLLEHCEFYMRISKLLYANFEVQKLRLRETEHNIG